MSIPSILFHSPGACPRVREGVDPAPGYLAINPCRRVPAPWAGAATVDGRPAARRGFEREAVSLWA